MSLAQFYNLPNKPKRSSTNPALPDADRSTLPGIQDLMREISTTRSNLSASRDDLFSRLFHQPTISPNHTQWDLHTASQTQVSSANAEPVKIYGFETRQADLYVWSYDPHLSDAQIKEMLTSVDGIYWGYCLTPDQAAGGYVGAHFDADYPIASEDGWPHTQITITWPRHTKTHLLTRLRMLARAGCERLPFWAELTGAVAAADQALAEGRAPKSVGQVTGLPAIFAGLNARPEPDQRYEPRLEEIDAFARYTVAPWPGNRPPLRDEKRFDVCGEAVFWQAWGKALWSPEGIRNAAALFKAEKGIFDSLGIYPTLADHWLNLVSFGQIEIVIAGVKLKYHHDGDGIPMGFWRQVIELEASKIPPQAIQYLQARQVCLSGQYSIAGGYDPFYGNALAAKLIAEAQQRKVFVPEGGFRTALPADMPIVGVEELCIWVDGENFWVLPLPGGMIFHWQPEQINLLSGSERDGGESAWNLILAALWHDLVTEGPKVIVRTGDDQPASHTKNQVEGKRRRQRSRSRPDMHMLRLPSSRVIRMDGVNTWGTPEEIEKINRQAHQVRGHRRKLRPGQQRSLYALANARNFSFILPDGYTFVRPYQTGLANPDAPATKETPILARGLASLMLMSKEYSKRSAA